MNILPSFSGLKWDQITSLGFKTQIQQAVAGNELRNSLQRYPRWTFKLNYEVLRDKATLAELQQLMGFYFLALGSGVAFLYNNPDDNAVAADSQFGVGSGVTTNYQLIRTAGGGTFLYTEPVQNVNVITNIKVNGVAVTVIAYATTGSPGAGQCWVSPSGLVTFGTAPGIDLAITWTGTYYYRCRFLNDNTDFNKMMSGLWNLSDWDFVGAIGNKV